MPNMYKTLIGLRRTNYTYSGLWWDKCEVIKRIESKKPTFALSATLATHHTDNRLGAKHNLYKIEQAFAR